MQRRLTYLRRSEEEEIKDNGLTLDFDEIARKGAMSGGEKLIGKWYGIYGSRQPGNHMARVVIPGGELTSAQARNIAKIAEDYGMGILNVTTRQAIQFHWLKAGRLADMLRDLRKEGSTTWHGCGDVTRTIAACPLAETCKYARFNVRKFAKSTNDYLTNCDDLENLPRKFKITFSGCSAGCGQPYLNCLGAIATTVKQNGEEKDGFKIVIGGGMGWRAFVAEELFSFIPKEKMERVARAVALLFRDYGDRFDRTTSRLKFVVHRQGIDKCREIVLDFLEKEGVDTSDMLTTPVEDLGLTPPDRPLIEDNPIGTDGKHTVDVRIPKGELNYRQFKQLAVLSEMYGNQRVYTTNRQNIQLKGIEPEKVEEVKAKVKELGFEVDGMFGLRDIVSCVGTTYCPKAVSRTRDMFDSLNELVNAQKYKEIEKKAIINITGCPNSCSPYRIADIGLRGMRIREELGSVEGYEIVIGGTQTNHGKKIGEFKFEDCVEVVENILDYFAANRNADETLVDTVERIGVKPFKEAVYTEA